MDTGNKGLDQSRHNPAAGNSQFNATVTPQKDAPPQETPEVQNTGKIKEMKEWQYKRDAMNRYFTSLGYTNINVNQKTFCEDAYGRERVSRLPDGSNRNKLTTDATARLMMEIVTAKAVTPQRSAQMMELLKRDYTGTSKDADDQSHGFTGIALTGIEGARLWSKAGWTSTTRHDVVYLELPNGSRFVLATFTTDHANEREIIPTVARVVIEGIASVK